MPEINVPTIEAAGPKAEVTIKNIPLKKVEVTHMALVTDESLHTRILNWSKNDLSVAEARAAGIELTKSEL